MSEICLMGVDSNSPGLLHRYACIFVIMFNHTCKKATEHFELLTQKHLEGFFLLVEHVIAQVGDIVITTWLISFRALHIWRAIDIALNRFLIGIELQEGPKTIEYARTLIV